MAQETLQQQAQRLQLDIERLKAEKNLSEQQLKDLSDKEAALSRINEILFKSVDYLKDQLKQLELQAETHEILAKQTGISVDHQKALLDIEIQKLNILIKEQEQNVLNATSDEERLKAQQEIVRLLKLQSKEFEKQKDLTRAEEKGKMLANLLGISEANKNSLTYQMFKNPNTIFDGFKKEVQDAGGISGALFTSITMKAQEAAAAILYLTKQQMMLADQSVSSFFAATGANEKYLQSVYDVGRGNTALGIGFAESGKAMTDLYTNLNTFTTLSKEARDSLTITTAKLEKLGISGAESAKSIQTLSMMMGVSEVQAADTVQQFAAMGQAIGVSSKQMISDFMAVKDQLAVFGSSMDETFLKLEAQAKATGVAVNDLINITNKFDTFEGAANQVAKLNAMLGGPYLSAMTMIETTDPTERINMIRESVNNAGMSFESMSYYQKKAIMEAGGFKSIEEAQRILSMSAGEAAEELQKQTASQEELNAAIERAQPIQQKMSMIMANFAIVIEPVVTGISKFLTGILKIQDEYPSFKYVLTGILLLFGAMLVAIPLLIAGLSIFANVATITAATAVPAAAGAEAAAAGVAAAGATLSAAAPVILIGSKAMFIFAAALLLVSLAAIGVGYALKLIFEGLALVLEQGVKAPEVFFGMALAIYALGAALAMLSLNPFAGVGMAILLASFYGIADAINSIETDKIVNFKTVMEKSVEISEPSTIEGFEKFSDKFEAVARATALVDASKTQTFISLLSATQNLSQALKLNQTVIVQVGDKKFEGYIKSVVNNMFPDSAISSRPNN